MDLDIEKVQRATEDYKGNRSVQTGFPSPATHYREPTIDLNKELSSSRDATFFVRVKSNTWKKYNILENDVLIIDKSITPLADALVLCIVDGEFSVMRCLEMKQKQARLWGALTYIIHKAI